MPRFIGVDLGWYGKPTGLASLEWSGRELHQRRIDRLESRDEIFRWIQSEAGAGSAVVAVDAPLVIVNDTGIRPAERDLNREFRRYHAGCHPANLNRPFAPHVTGFSRELEALGFAHGVAMRQKERGRFQIEVHPHAATVSLFGLDRIVKYKRGRRAERARELSRLRRLMTDHLGELDPPVRLKLPVTPRKGSLKPVEDQLDAVLCAYIAGHWWRWAQRRNHVFGTADEGYVVVPRGGERTR